MERDFEGKVAIVTGAAGGIGRAAAEQFAARGASVILADIAAVDETAALITAGGGEATGVCVDVTDPDSVAAMVQAAVDRYGRLDVGFNNAGISHPQLPFHDAPLDDWHKVIAVDLTGVYLCMREELRVLAAQGEGGAICNTSSGAGVVAAPMQAAYTAAKHGVLGLVKVAAGEYARQGIRINAILPGMTDTPMMRASIEASPGLGALIPKITPTGALASAEEVAAAAVWLCSPSASYVSGVSLLVDGGMVNR